jgi:hypothetical protein
MAWQIFGTLPAGNQLLSVIDTLTAEIAKCVLVPCTAAGTNTIVLTGTTNAPSNIAAYSDLVQFSFIAAATSTGTVTIAFGALAPLNVYFADGVTQVAAGGIVSGQPYTAIYSQALNSGMGGFYLGQAVQRVTGLEPTRQVFTSGTALTYTTPAGAKQLVIRMCGGGGSGGGSPGNAGNAGTASQFNAGAFTANGGSAGGAASSSSSALTTGGAGGTGGAGTASVRLAGGAGGAGSGVTGVASLTVQIAGGLGGVSYFGGGGGGTAAANSGSGGQGANGSVAGATSGAAAAGGGAGEYVEIVINTPVATYTYTVGAGGTAPAGGSAGGSGIIIVEERY